jgi:hypothetical protein
MLYTLLLFFFYLFSIFWVVFKIAIKFEGVNVVTIIILEISDKAENRIIENKLMTHDINIILFFLIWKNS